MQHTQLTQGVADIVHGAQHSTLVEFQDRSCANAMIGCECKGGLWNGEAGCQVMKLHSMSSVTWAPTCASVATLITTTDFSRPLLSASFVCSSVLLKVLMLCDLGACISKSCD